MTLADAGAQVVALDQSPEMLARARAKLRHQDISWVLHRLPDPLPFRDAMFDVVVLGLVAEHVADLLSLLTEAARVLVPGGRCILSALHPEMTARPAPRFIDPATGVRRPIVTYRRTADEYLAAAEAVGLREPEVRRSSSRPIWPHACLARRSISDSRWEWPAPDTARYEFVAWIGNGSRLRIIPDLASVSLVRPSIRVARSESKLRCSLTIRDREMADTAVAV